MNDITNISIDRLIPHPHNPRRQLGDLTELADSIRNVGLFQPLTVVPTGDDYIVVIGHRRRAAAQLAGWSELPCIIADMTEAEQISTMLLENIQRSELTPIEEAAGFQMLLDLGESVDDIATRTGFSESTVRRRVKLLDLDRKALEAADERGGTLADYAALDAIRDPDKRNEVLKAVGTDNFAFQLKRAIEAEVTAEKRGRLLDKLRGFATEVTERKPEHRTVKYFYPRDVDSFVAPDDADEREYFFIMSQYSIDLMVIRDEVSTPGTPPPETAEQRDKRERREQLDKLSATAYELRHDFVLGFMPQKKHTQDIMRFAISVMDGGWCEDIDLDVMTEYFGFVAPDDTDADTIDEMSTAAFKQLVADKPERVLFVLAYLSYNDDGRENYRSYDMTHRENETLSELYDHLCNLGYKMSDDEKALRDGTHELYASAEED